MIPFDLPITKFFFETLDPPQYRSFHSKIYKCQSWSPLYSLQDGNVGQSKGGCDLSCILVIRLCSGCVPTNFPIVSTYAFSLFVKFPCVCQVVPTSTTLHPISSHIKFYTLTYLARWNRKIIMFYFGSVHDACCFQVVHQSKKPITKRKKINLESPPQPI